MNLNVLLLLIAASLTLDLVLLGILIRLLRIWFNHG